jgi:hypothetical protein
MGNPQTMERLSEEFRARTKGYAAGVIRLYVKLPRARSFSQFPLSTFCSLLFE